MIPKKIHYCWFGRGEKNKLVNKCIASWKQYCPDYEIIEWNEDNFDVYANDYLKYCYENKKWAYLSDLARLIIVYEQGGVYFDTDVELIRNPDSLLQYSAFYCFENDNNVATGLGFGAEANNDTVKAMADQYKGISRDENGGFLLQSCPKLNTEALLPYGLELNGKKQLINNVMILSTEYMNPLDDPTGRLTITDKTISIHWYLKSALSKKSIIKSKITRPIHRIFGVDSLKWLKK